MRQRYSSSVAVPLSHSTVPLTHSVLSQQLPVAGRSQTLTGQKGMVECQRRGTMVAVLLHLWLVVVDVLVTRMRLQSHTLLRLPREFCGLPQG